MKILFCNIGWMRQYKGIYDGDSIERGGSYNKDNIGHEVCNFSNVDGKVFGYVQPVNNKINIENLGAGKDALSIGGITVAWLASNGKDGTVVVGWYENATVYRNEQQLLTPSKEQTDSGVETYFITAFWDDVVLLPIETRLTRIPRAKKGGIGQSNVWYAKNPESTVHVERVKNLIYGYKETNKIPDIDEEVIGVEGNPKLKNHLVRERNSSIIKKKRSEVLAEKGCLKCEVCNFDFFETYGEAGKEFCEVHHLMPLNQCNDVVETRLSDLAIVCSNCHRILHRSKPMLTLENLRELLKNRK